MLGFKDKESLDIGTWEAPSPQWSPHSTTGSLSLRVDAGTVLSPFTHHYYLPVMLLPLFTCVHRPLPISLFHCDQLLSNQPGAALGHSFDAFRETFCFFAA